MHIVRGGLLNQIRNRTEKNPVAMQSVGKFLDDLGLNLETANIFALQLALNVADAAGAKTLNDSRN